jgi:Acetyltransferase (GNAT) family
LSGRLFTPPGDGLAEVAFAIAADYQGQGLATILLGQLADAAPNGIDTFEAIVLSENRRMLDVLRESGFPVKTHYESGTVEATFPSSLTPHALARFEQREELASASALQCVLYPHSVAVSALPKGPLQLVPRWFATCWRQDFPVRSIRSTGPPVPSSRYQPSPGSMTSQVRSSWPSSRCRLSTCLVLPRSAAAKECTLSSS